jgi:hypothetical protein
VVRASALVNKGSALADTPDRHDEGIALLEQAIAEAEAGDFGYVLHRALFNLLVHQIDVWPPARSHAVLRRMRETGERTGRGSEAPGWAMQRSEIAVIEGDLEAALAAARGARGHELVPLEGWVDPLWVDLREASLLLERGQLDQAEALLERHPEPPEPTAVSCDVGWLWAQRMEVAARRGDLAAVRVAMDGLLAAAPWWGWRWKHSHLGLHGPIAALRAGLPPAEVRLLVEAVDRDAPAGPTAGARAGRLARTWRRPCWRPRATRPPPWPATGRCSTTPTSTGPPTCGPTATTAPPAACWPSVTSPAPSTRPGPPPACWSAGPAGGATRPRPCCAASARARPRPTARTC